MIDNDGLTANITPTAYDPYATLVMPDGNTRTASSICQDLSRLESVQTRMTSMNAKVQNLEDTLKQYLDDEEIEEDVATEIANIFGISLDKTIEVTVNVEFTFTLTLPRDADLDDVVQNFSFSADTYGSDAEIESEDFTIVDWNESKGW